MVTEEERLDMLAPEYQPMRGQPSRWVEVSGWSGDEQVEEYDVRSMFIEMQVGEILRSEFDGSSCILEYETTQEAEAATREGCDRKLNAVQMWVRHLGLVR